MAGMTDGAKSAMGKMVLAVLDAKPLVFTIV